MGSFQSNQQGGVNSFNTNLSKPEEKQFLDWRMKKSPDRPLDDGQDYDYRGFFKSGQGQTDNGHFTDQFKKPNHPTFSVESQYSDPSTGTVGGQWVGDNFKPSPYNLKNMPLEELKKYFSKVEPNGKVLE